MNNAALNARIATVFSAIRASKVPLTASHIRDSLKLNFTPVWELEQLQARGAIRRVTNVPGVDCVDGRYEAIPMRAWKY